MADLTPYRTNTLQGSLARIQGITEVATTANIAVANQHIYATNLVCDTLERAACMMPSHPTQKQIAAVREETRAYLNQIEGIEYRFCQQILSVVEAIAQLPE